MEGTLSTADASSIRRIPSARGVIAALTVPIAFIVAGHALLLVSVNNDSIIGLLIFFVMIMPALGLVFCPWAAGVAQRRDGGSSGAINGARTLALCVYLLLGLFWIFGVPFDGEFFLGGGVG